MPALSIILIGCDGAARLPVMAALAGLDIEIEDEFPDFRAAVARPASSHDWTGGRPAPGRPRAVIARVAGGDDVHGLGWLRQVYGAVPVIALVHAGEEGVARALDGGARVVPWPPEIGAVRAAMGAVLPPVGPPKVIAVAGATGGCGATTIAVNLACEFATRGPCTLVELAPWLGVLADHLDVRPERTLADLLAEGNRLDAYRVRRALAPAGDELTVLAGPPPGARPPAHPPGDVLRVVELVRGLGGVVVVDVPCTHDELYFAALAAADRAVLVGGQRVPTLRAMRLVAGELAARVPGRPPVLVINRFDPRLEGFGVRDLGRVLGATGLVVAEDARAVADAINRGVPVRRRAPSSPAATDIVALARELSAPAGPRPPALGWGSGIVAGGSVVRRMIDIFRTG